MVQGMSGSTLMWLCLLRCTLSRRRGCIENVVQVDVDRAEAASGYVLHQETHCRRFGGGNKDGLPDARATEQGVVLSGVKLAVYGIVHELKGPAFFVEGADGDGNIQ